MSVLVEQAKPSRSFTRAADSARSSRNVPLDVLRGLAILLVLGRHAIIDPDAAGWLITPATVLREFGWTGVDLFFVLSGFLVGGLIFGEIRKHGDFHAWRFIKRRWFRTLPLYVAYLPVMFFLWQHESGLFSWDGLQSNIRLIS